MMYAQGSIGKIGKNRQRAKSQQVLPSLSTEVSEPCTRSQSFSFNNNVQKDPVSPFVLPGHRVEREGYMDIGLYEAAAKGDYFALKRVVDEKGAQNEVFWQVDPQGNTLLHVAASNGSSLCVQLILQTFPSMIMEQNLKGDTALHYAAKVGNLCSQLTEFYKCFAPSPKGLLHMKNGKGNTALHEALINGHQGCALFLAEEDHESINFVNKEGKSAMYLAVDTGSQELVRCFLSYEIKNQKFQGKSALQAAIRRRNIGLMDTILQKEPMYLHSKDDQGRTALHFAASMGYIKEVEYLIGTHGASTTEKDKNGLFPIHLAAAGGHVQVIKELLNVCPYSKDMVNHHGQNILHIAAQFGKRRVVKYVLQTPTFENLINEGDESGNTPLHLAAMKEHVMVISLLTCDKRVDLKAVNNEGLTALDIASNFREKLPSFEKRLVSILLKEAGAPYAVGNKRPIARAQALDQKQLSLVIDKYKDRVNTLLLVATLVATVTFSAGLTLPGGYNNSDQNQGFPALLGELGFSVFTLFNAIAMYTSITVVVTLIWAQLGYIALMITTLKLAIPLLGVALLTMTAAFMVGICLVVSKLKWLALAVLIMGSAFLVALLALILPLCFPVLFSYYFLRCLSYYPFYILVLLNEKIRSDSYWMHHD